MPAFLAKGLTIFKICVMVFCTLKFYSNMITLYDIVNAPKRFTVYLMVNWVSVEVKTV